MLRRYKPTIVRVSSSYRGTWRAFEGKIYVLRPRWDGVNTFRPAGTVGFSWSPSKTNRLTDAFCRSNGYMFWDGVVCGMTAKQAKASWMAQHFPRGDVGSGTTAEKVALAEQMAATVQYLDGLTRRLRRAGYPIRENV